MKNLLLLFASTKVDKMNCIDLSGYDDATDKADWLKKHGEDVCESTLYERAQETHSINSDITFLPGKPLRKDLSQIKNLVNNYGRYQVYIGFIKDGNDIVDWKTINNHTKLEPCYSIPLFLSIIDRFDLGEGSYFEFKNATVEDVTTIIVEVTKGNTVTAFFDFSNEPTVDGLIHSEI